MTLVAKETGQAGDESDQGCKAGLCLSRGLSRVLATLEGKYLSATEMPMGVWSRVVLVTTHKRDR